MSQHTLTALDGRTPLGWLATLGLLRVLAEEAEEPSVADPRLGWDNRTGQARLTVPGSLDDVVAAVAGVITHLDSGACLPGGPPDFPPATKPSDDWPRFDPMRMPLAAFRTRVEEWQSTADGDFFDRWVPAMVTDQVADDSKSVEVTSYAAPSGKQNFKTMFDKSLERVRGDHELIHQALLRWHRVSGMTGEYLDHRVLRSRADHPRGEKGAEIGVPGATWLALMALPWLPAHGSAGRAVSTGWQARPRRRSLMVWPLWSADLPVAAVRTLLAHPGLAITSDQGNTPSIDGAALHPLSVFAVFGAERQTVEGRKSAGVLAPRPVSWS